MEILERYSGALRPVVPFRPGLDRLLPLDFTAANTGLDAAMLEDTAAFSRYVGEQIEQAGARYGIGGYGEHRTIYSRSRVFDAPAGEEPRRLHLGTDIWGPAGTPVFAPLPGTVHSFAFNDAFGDYGATIILQHQLDSLSFHTLYGHLDLPSLQGLQEGKSVEAGARIASFGPPEENGHWPPHLHFQLIRHLEGRRGDYLGVCRYSERAHYLANCPDPDLLLRMNRWI